MVYLSWTGDADLPPRPLLKVVQIVNTTLISVLITMVAHRIGLSIHDNERDAFCDRIQARMKSCRAASLHSYVAFLSAGTPEAAEEWQALSQSLTTGESYFFRDRRQHELLRNHILPRLLELRREQKTVRVWSAGCSSGEEPYSLAMLLNELLPDRTGWRILIMGTDINAAALDKARRGVYTQWSFRMVDPATQARYFTRKQDTWELDRNIRDLVTFSLYNLVEECIPARASNLHSMDLIICRNVFIYFSPNAVNRVMEKFAAVLNDGGYVITGHGEVSHSALTGFTTVVRDDLVCYQKTGTNVPKPAIPLVVGAPEIPVMVDRACRPRTDVARQAPGVTADVSDRAEHEPCDAEAEFLKARASADIGRYDDALRICREVLERTPTFAPAYLLLAQIAEIHGKRDEAREYLKKAIFLKHDYVAAYLELGRIYAQERDARRAEQMYGAATDFLRSLPPDAPVAPYPDITVGELLRHLEELRNHPGA